MLATPAWRQILHPQHLRSFARPSGGRSTPEPAVSEAPEPTRDHPRPRTRDQVLTRTHQIGVASNAGLAALKLTVGSLAGSRALVADGVHSLTDVLMNAGAWLGWRWASRPPDANHHYGHGNAEALTSLTISLIIAAVGGGLIASSFRGQSTVSADALGAAAVATQLVSIAAKLVLARITSRRGREHGSAILIAVARDNAADVLTSAVILIAIVGSILGLAWLEPLAAAAIGLLIVWQGLRGASEGLGVLMARTPDQRLTVKIERIAAAITGVQKVDRVRIHPLGTHLRADLEISVDGQLSVAEGHAIADGVRDAVVAGCGRVEEATVHVNPYMRQGGRPREGTPALPGH
jgi:cation diffusion facilitator family transporter